MVLSANNIHLLNIYYGILYLLYARCKIYRGYLLFEVNTKYISPSALKIPMFSTHEMKYIWYLPKKVNFLFILYFFGDLQLIE